MPKSTNKIPAILPSIHHRIGQWYARFGRRELPWRNTRDPYHVYISEIMLQQTQVRTVLDRYYGPFLKRFPSLKALAEAETEAIVKQWEGLGYYTRARNLHKAAQACGGVLPETPEALHALPGIGRNTAHAVACFGFGAAVPIMEANVKRVLCRVFALKAPDEATLWEKAALLLDAKNAFDYNQAMMDIGAMVCTRRSPRCGECPLNAICQGKADPEAYPQAKKTKAVPVRKRAIVVFAAPDGYYLICRTTRFLGGLYGFHEVEEGEQSVTLSGEQHILAKARLLGGVIQVYSHFRLEAKAYLMPVTAKVKMPPGSVKATLEEIARLPLSKADHKVVQLVKEYLQNGLKKAG